MKKLLSERARMLEEAGFDTRKYNLNAEEIGKMIELADEVVEDKQVNNNRLFRRWVMAQTFKMLGSYSFNSKNERREYGYDAYLRNWYPYQYQFTMMLDELKTISKLELKDESEFAVRARFFNKEVVIATCNDYIKRAKKYIAINKNKNGYVKLSKYGAVKIEDTYCLFFNKLEEEINNMKESEKYMELYVYLKNFMKHMFKLPASTTKCSAWLDAYKGTGAYATLQNMILFHECLLPNCDSKEQSIHELNVLLDTYENEYWKFHVLLKETIQLNDFDLIKSIEAQKVINSIK